MEPPDRSVHTCPDCWAPSSASQATHQHQQEIKDAVHTGEVRCDAAFRSNRNKHDQHPHVPRHLNAASEHGNKGLMLRAELWSRFLSLSLWVELKREEHLKHQKLFNYKILLRP